MSEKDFNEIFSNRLRFYLSKNNMTQLELAKKLQVGTTSVYNWCNGIKTPRMDKVDAMCNLFGIMRRDLMEENNSQGVKINVLGRVAAGIPIEAVEDIIDTEEIPEALARTGDFFALQIHGDSMEPRMYEGDVVIVRKQNDAESGDIVIAMINGDDATCKRLVKYASGISLISLNSKYSPMMFSNEEIINKPVRILGKVIELRGKF
ncbi:MAG: helix-turn-helix domain-containing protein [Lachnospiraceae bacterium]|nr:helix-turn-helix domain-containing protein [Lachnospiraceae bacterium]